VVERDPPIGQESPDLGFVIAQSQEEVRRRMLLAPTFASRFRRADQTGPHAVAHLPVIAGQQSGDRLGHQRGEAGGTGGDNRLVACG